MTGVTRLRSLTLRMTRLSAAIVPLLCAISAASADPHEPTSRYVLMDFEDAVVVNNNLLVKPSLQDVVLPSIGPKGDSGVDTIEVAVGEGRGGGNALRVVANKFVDKEGVTKDNLPGFFLTMSKNRPNNMNAGNVGGYEGYMLPRGMRANRLEMWVKLPDGFRKGYASRQPPRYPNHKNFDLGTYNFNPTTDGWNTRLVESSNWHFYHMFFMRHEKAGDGWMRIVINEWSSHQRSLSQLDPPHNPTSPAGNYFETMTRIYLDPSPYFTSPEIEYPVKMLVDDISLSYVPEPKDVIVDFPGLVRGHITEIQRATGTEPTQVVSTDLPFIVRNVSKQAITGTLSVDMHYGLKPQVIDPATGKALSMDMPLSLAAGETRSFSLRVSPTSDCPPGTKRNAAVHFVPSSEFQKDSESTNRSFANPLVENRAIPEAGALDGFVYSDFITVRVVDGPPSENTPPDSEGGITCSVKGTENLSAKLVAQDPNNDPITFSVARQPEKGTLTLNSSNGSFTYTPRQPLTKYDFFWYKVSDGKGTSEARAVWIVGGSANGCEIAPAPAEPPSTQPGAPRNVRITG